MTMASLTESEARVQRDRILADIRFHRAAARRRLRDLDRLEADCARVGIRLIRQPVQSPGGQSRGRPNPIDR